MKNPIPIIINKHRDWNYFNFLLENTINLSTSLKTTDQLKSEVYNFTTAVKRAAWKSTPIIQRKLKGLNKPNNIMDMDKLVHRRTKQF